VQNDGISDHSKRIVFTEAEINRLVLLWQKKRQRPPTRTELNGLIQQQIREEVLYREAMAMGLDKNDSIVRRRLAQKLEFITADLAAQAEPTDKELIAYLNEHQEKFKSPRRIDFTHIYFSIEKRGATAELEATKLLNKLNLSTSKQKISAAGDAFMMGQNFKNSTQSEVSRLFGKNFANKVSILSADKWFGPIISGYGYHLVYIENIIAEQPAKLSLVREKVRFEWMNKQRIKIDKAFYKGLRQAYDITIEDYKLNGKLTMSAN
jgi:hypothetical protein